MLFCLPRGLGKYSCQTTETEKKERYADGFLSGLASGIARFTLPFRLHTASITNLKSHSLP